MWLPGDFNHKIFPQFLRDFLWSKMGFAFSSWEKSGFRVSCVSRVLWIFFGTVKLMKFQQKCPFAYLNKKLFFEPWAGPDLGRSRSVSLWAPGGGGCLRKHPKKYWEDRKLNQGIKNLVQHSLIAALQDLFEICLWTSPPFIVKFIHGTIKAFLQSREF